MESNHHVEIFAEMSCEGCSNAITRILNEVEGVVSVECDIPNQRVRVFTHVTVTGEILVEKLGTWAENAGKRVAVI